MTMRLSDIVASLPDARLTGVDTDVAGISHRSRDVGPGDVFAAIAGANHDGHDFVGEAVQNGAVAVLATRDTGHDVPHVIVSDVRTQLGEVASVIYGRPSENMAVFGVTGTNGKTTVTSFIEGACAANGMGTGVIGTVATRIHGESEPGVRTTPEATELQHLLATMYRRGVDAVAMEVSSHGLDLRRVDGTRFACVVFTNLSQDHLDYHRSMDAYFAAKQRLFTPDFASQGVVFVGDSWAQQLADTSPIPVVTVGFDGPVDVTVAVRGPAQARLLGTISHVGEIDETLRVPIPGAHNLANGAVAAVAAACSGIPMRTALDGIASSPGVSGRFEPVMLPDGPRAYVDFAHTPDAVRAVVAAAKALCTDAGRVILVVGCGGDRDPEKRGPMGAAATTADVAVLTSDNPRSEDPEAILAAIARGAEQAVQNGETCTIHLDVDRRSAIAYAVSQANPNDVIVIAGKGHETTQIFADRTVVFDDRHVLRDAYNTFKGL